MAYLGRLLRQGCIVERAGCDRIQGQVELVVPTEFESCARQLIIPGLCTRVTLHHAMRVKSSAN